MTRPHLLPPLLLLLFLLLVVCRGAASAQAADSTAVADTLWREAGGAARSDMGEVVVTATRTRRLLKDVPVPTRVIGRRDIELADATDLRALLQQELPGVEFTYSMNQRLNMNMGGFSGRSVLILVDGERLAGETTENVDFARTDLGGVERIEIVRGAQSALYGAGAVGGVVNIITRDAAAPWALNLNARLADHREQRYGGSLALSRGGVGNTLDFRYVSRDTYDVCRDMADACEFRSVWGGRTWNVADRLSFRPAPGLRLAARAGAFFREQHTDADTRERARGFAGGLRADWDMSPSDRLEMSLSYDQYDKSDLLRLWGRDVLDYRNVQVSARALYSRTLRVRDVLTAGGGYVRDFLHTYQFADGRARVQHTGHLFAQYDCLVGRRWEAVAAARWDHFADRAASAPTSASALTARAAVRRTAGPVALRAGYAAGFRAPTLKEKYSRFNMVGDIYVTGNEALKPEYSHNLTLSAEYAPPPSAAGTLTLALSASYSDVSDRISTSAPVRGTEGEYAIRYVNLPRVRVLGLELTACGRRRLDARHALEARAAYAFTREWAGPAGAAAAAYCPARPHSANLRLDLDSRWTRSCATTLSLLGRVLSAVDYATVQMAPPYDVRHVHTPAYTIWKLQLQGRLGRGLRLTLALDNIFNYAPRVYSFNSPVTLGINLMAGVSLDVERLF